MCTSRWDEEDNDDMYEGLGTGVTTKGMDWEVGKIGEACQEPLILHILVAGPVDVTVGMSSADSFVIWSAGPSAAAEGDASTFHPFATV